MSQQSPPPPYDGQPAPANPYGHGTHQPEPAAPRPGMSEKAKFWTGFVLALPVNFVAVVVVGAAAAAAGEGLTGVEAVGAVISGILGLALLAGLVLAFVAEKTRRFALGLLAGTVILLVLAIAAIVLLFVALTSSMS